MTRHLRNDSRFAAAGDGLAGLAIGGFTALGFALVPHLLTLGEGEFNFDSSVAKVHARGDEGKSFLLRFADELVQLAAVDQKFAGAQRLVIEDVAVLVYADVGVDEPQLAVYGCAAARD